MIVFSQNFTKIQEHILEKTNNHQKKQQKGINFYKQNKVLIDLVEEEFNIEKELNSSFNGYRNKFWNIRW